MPILDIAAHIPKIGVAIRGRLGGMTVSESVARITLPSRLARERFSIGAAYVSLLSIAALLLLVWQIQKFEGDLIALAFLIGLNVAAGLMPISVYGDSQLSASFVFALAAIVLFGMPGAVILALISALGPALATRRLSRNALLNVPIFILVGAGAAAGYDLVAIQGPESISVAVGVGVFLDSVISFGLTSVLLGVLFSLNRSQSLDSFWDRHPWIAPYYAAMAVAGFVLVSAYVTLGVSGLVAFVTPAFMMRLAMKQYVSKTTDVVNKLKEQNAELQSTNVEIRLVSEELHSSYDGTLEALVNALDARDQETKGHSLRVSSYMMDIAREIGVKEGTQEWTDMPQGSLLHDVGKIGVSDSILLKPGKLTDEEWTTMRQHPGIGYNMLRQVKFLEGPAEIILAHHERWDGNGYPRKLRAEEIPLGARIFTVVDTFDSMTSDRPHRKALSTMDAMNEILRFSGEQFWPAGR